MSKGSKRRKPLVDSETVSDNWDRIFNSEKKTMKRTVKRITYKVVGTVLVKVSRAIAWVNAQIDKADVAVGSLGMEMLDIADEIERGVQ
jgi:hypothetical protein